MGKSLLYVTSLALLGGVAATPGSAQERAAVHLVPRIGYQSGGHVLGTTRLPETLSGEFVPNLGLPVDMSKSPLLGVGIEMDLPVRWLAFRATLDRTVRSDLLEPPRAACGENCVGIGPGPWTEAGGLAKWTMATDVLFQPVPRSWPVRPFVAVGTGVDWYRFDEPPERKDEFRRGTGDRWTASAHLGFGLDVRIADRTFRTEVSFLRSERDDVLGWTVRDGLAPRHPVTISRNQDVVAVTVGLRVPMR